jgi:protein-disulfide isomerase
MFKAGGGKMNDEHVRRDDHVLGNPNAPVTLVEYGDFQCPDCARAHQALKEMRAQFGDELCLVYRHLPLADAHPFAELAAEAAEAAGAQGMFWEMHDALFDYQSLVVPDEVPSMAQGIGLDLDSFRDDMISHRHREHVLDDAAHARAIGVTGTPAFFINGQPYNGKADPASLGQAVREALRNPARPA